MSSKGGGGFNELRFEDSKGKEQIFLHAEKNLDVPYLVRLVPGDPFTEWVLDAGWGNHWGVFAVTGADLRAMRQHLRRFLIVHDPAGKPLVFRYYDPRVLRTYLPTCNAEELAAIFGPVAQYLAEGEDAKELLRFRLAGEALAADKASAE